MQNYVRILKNNGRVLLEIKSDRFGPDIVLPIMLEVKRVPLDLKLTIGKVWGNKKLPEGDGYLLWETTSEGSPTSPVFSTLDELCGWCAKNKKIYGLYTLSIEAWKEIF